MGRCKCLWIQYFFKREHIDESFMLVYVESLGEYVPLREIYMVLAQLLLAFITWLFIK